MISQGADFIVSNANAAGLGAIQAVKEAGPEISTFSAYSDFTELAPENILSVYLADYGQGIVRIVKNIEEGNPPDSNIEFGLADDDVIKFTFSEQAAEPVSEELRKQVEEVKAKIIAGEIQTREK
jgi:basic membrane protein A